MKRISLYQHVMPWATKPACVEFLRQKGPAFWKSLDLESDSKRFEVILMLILTEPSLAIQLPVYLHLWDNDLERLPVHIYEMGWGHHLQQSGNVFQLWYLQSLNPTDVGREPVISLPVLTHAHDYYPFNVDYTPEVHADHKGRPVDVKDMSLEEMYYMHLFCAESCSKRERWSECFAHALSALDFHTEPDPHLHNVYCQLALAAGKMSLYSDVWIRLLCSARQKDEFIYHKWRRIVTFHSLLVHHGLFDLEYTVFCYARDHIPSASTFHTRLLTQHLQSLMAQVENIAGFQFLRQTFHETCDARTCGKPPLLEFSFARSANMIRDMEKILQYLPTDAQRHYFQGYVYLYKSFGSVLNVPTEKDKTYLELAKSSFELATLETDCTTPTALVKDLLFMRASLKNLDIDDVTIEESFSALTNTKYNIEAANTCFRVLLLFYYWGNTCVRTPPVAFADTASRAYKKSTAYTGYRIDLIGVCQRQLNFGVFEHSEDAESDFPPVECMSVSNGDFKTNVENYWKMEMGHLPNSPINCCTTSQQLLSNFNECRELYAFGAQIVTNLIQ